MDLKAANGQLPPDSTRIISILLLLALFFTGTLAALREVRSASSIRTSRTSSIALSSVAGSWVSAARFTAAPLSARSRPGATTSRSVGRREIDAARMVSRLTLRPAPDLIRGSVLFPGSMPIDLCSWRRLRTAPSTTSGTARQPPSSALDPDCRRSLTRLLSSSSSSSSSLA